MPGRNRGIDPAPDIELSDHFKEPWRQQFHQIIEDLVDHGLVESPNLPIVPEVELQGLQFHATRIWDVTEAEGREVRLSGLGTDTGKLRATEFDRVVTIRFRVGKGLKHPALHNC